jgi:hypothetical protein
MPIIIIIIIITYEDVAIEIQRMWNLKTKAARVNIEETGTISKSFRKYLKNIPVKHDIRKLQKTSILGTAHIVQKYKTFIVRNNLTYAIYCTHRIASTLYTLQS